MAKDKILYFRSMVRVLRILAFPISLVYAFVVWTRNFFYDKGWFTSWKFDVPTICVGNLSVGGTGKTPMIEYLIRLLVSKQVAVLSRGYKRKSNGFVLADSKATVEDLGDEPFQIHKKFQEVAVAVDADRQNGMRELIKTVKPDVVLLDDAFQHRKVTPSFSILLTPFSKLYAEDWYLPTGNLRDSKKQSQRADVIIVTKCPNPLSYREREEIVIKLNPAEYQKVLFSWYVYAEYALDSSGKEVDWSQFAGKHVAVITGIAMPRPFIEFLCSLGIKFEHLAFGDHHFFTENEIEKFNDFDAVLTTEKDYVRLEGRVEDLFYVQVSHNLSKEDKETLEKMITEVV